MLSCIAQRSEAVRSAQGSPSSANSEEDLARLIGSDGAVRHEQGRVLAAEQAKTPKVSRRQESIFVVEYGATANGAAFRVDTLSTKFIRP